MYLECAKDFINDHIEQSDYVNSALETNPALPLARSKIADYVTLMKPELTLLSVLTALGGYFLGADGRFYVMSFVQVFVGTLLIGGGAGALNQFIEREYDALMHRTVRRPLPSGRITPAEVLVFGIVLSVAGIVVLAVFTNLLAAALGCITLVTYLFLYTPLKRITWVATIVGGIPGALPPLIGYAASRGEITTEAWILAAILFLWQMPHFYSLAWMYRDDYRRAGFPMLTVIDEEGGRTTRQILLFTLGLLAASMLLAYSGGSGIVFVGGALSAGIAFLYCGLELRRTKSARSARRLFFASLAYLPVLLAFLVLDRF